MVEGILDREVQDIAQSQGHRHRQWWPWYTAVIVLLVGHGLLATTPAAKRARPIRIGVLTASWGPTPQVVGLLDGLLALGYRENVDFELGVRFTAGEIATLPAAARQLVQYEVDLIIADSDEPAKAAQQATMRIPIVFAAVADPVGVGLVQSFARPGGNITGVTDLELQLGPKRLQIFRELLPNLQRVLFAYDAVNVFDVAAARIYREAAPPLGIELIERTVQTKEEARATFTQVRKGEIDGLLAPPYASLNISGFILELATQQAIPSMFGTAFLVESGGLASYGPDNYETGRQAARLVDKILKGAHPAEVTVEVNTKIEFVINLKVAKALGLTIAPEVLYQADRILR